MRRKCKATALDRRQESCVICGEGDDLYAAMLEDIGQARDAIQLESHIFAGDEIGSRFGKGLTERVDAGVHVRVHVRWFNRWRWRDPWHYNRCNHRKLLVVDDRSVYLGGFKLHRESSRMVAGSRRWRDVHARLTGRLAAPVSPLFHELWDGRRAQTPPARYL